MKKRTVTSLLLALSMIAGIFGCSSENGGSNSNELQEDTVNTTKRNHDVVMSEDFEISDIYFRLKLIGDQDAG